MVLSLAWVAFGTAFVIAAAFGVLFWRALFSSIMEREVATLGVGVYMLGALAILAMMFFTPL